MKQKEKIERSYWIWVTAPKYYLDEDGNDAIGDPKVEDSPLNSKWTCHKDTKKGDLILLYRSRKNKDIGYLIQAISNAYSLADDKEAKINKWSYGCECRFIYKFSNPLTLAEMKASYYLSESFSALRAGFRKLVYRISLADWKRLSKMLVKKNPSYEKVLKKMERSAIADEILLEEHLEQHLVDNPKVLKKFGHDLEVKERQFICTGGHGILDLLCYDKRKNHFVVIELKNVRAGQNTFAQISNYIVWVKENYAKRKRVTGLVISDDSDIKFQSSVKNSKYPISQLNIRDLGFKNLS